MSRPTAANVHPERPISLRLFHTGLSCNTWELQGTLAQLTHAGAVRSRHISMARGACVPSFSSVDRAVGLKCGVEVPDQPVVNLWGTPGQGLRNPWPP